MKRRVSPLDEGRGEKWERWEPAYKPGSVGGSHSSGMHVAVHLKRPTREPVRAARRGRNPPVPLFGLAPSGVYPAAGVAIGAVRSYRTISPLPTRRQRVEAVCFLWHFPWARAPQALPGTLPCGARTFLPRGRAAGAAARPTPVQEFTTHGSTLPAKTGLFFAIAARLSPQPELVEPIPLAARDAGGKCGGLLEGKGIR